MRYLLLIASLLVSFPVVLQAETAPEEIFGEAVPTPIVITPELIEAYQAYQLAQLRWQQYRLVELPRQRQLLDGQVRLLDSELQVLKRRWRDYRPFLLVGDYSPVRTAAENNRLTLQATEQQLKLLKNERINLMRFRRQHGQLYRLEVLRAATRVRQIVAATQVPLGPLDREEKIR